MRSSSNPPRRHLAHTSCLPFQRVSLGTVMTISFEGATLRTSRCARNTYGDALLRQCVLCSKVTVAHGVCLVAKRRRAAEERGRLAIEADDLGCGGVRLVACLANHVDDRALDLVARAYTYGDVLLRQCVLCSKVTVAPNKSLRQFMYAAGSGDVPP